MASSGFAQVDVVALEHRSFADVGPLDLDAVAPEHEAAVAVVAAHDEVGEGVVDLGRVGAARQGGEGLRDRAGAPCP